MAKVPNDSAFDNTNMAERVSKFDVAHYHQEDPLLRVNQIDDLEILLQNKIDAYVVSIEKCFGP